VHVLRRLGRREVDVPARGPLDLGGLPDDVVGVDDGRAGLELLGAGEGRVRLVHGVAVAGLDRGRAELGIGLARRAALREVVLDARGELVAHAVGLRVEADDARAAVGDLVVLDDELHVVVDEVLARGALVAHGDAARVARLAAGLVVGHRGGREAVEQVVVVVAVLHELLHELHLDAAALDGAQQVAVGLLGRVDLVRRVLDAVAREELAEVLLDVHQNRRLAEVVAVRLVGHVRLGRREAVDLEPDAVTGFIVMGGNSRQDESGRRRTEGQESDPAPGAHGRVRSSV